MGQSPGPKAGDWHLRRAADQSRGFFVSATPFIAAHLSMRVDQTDVGREAPSSCCSRASIPLRVPRTVAVAVAAAAAAAVALAEQSHPTGPAPPTSTSRCTSDCTSCLHQRSENTRTSLYPYRDVRSTGTSPRTVARACVCPTWPGIDWLGMCRDVSGYSSASRPNSKGRGGQTRGMLKLRAILARPCHQSSTNELPWVGCGRGLDVAH